VPKEIGKLNVSISAEALQEVISSGRVLEMTAKMAREAAAQISAQIVDHIAKAAANKGGLQAASVSAAFVFDGGDFGTVPHRPHWGVGPIGGIENTLQRFAAQENRAE
jgi:dTDP-4-dehydrorhamnose reductase